MKALIIYAHPNPESFNAAIRGSVQDELTRNGADVRVHDLYASNFNAILKADDFTEMFKGRVPEDVQPLQADIAWADLLVLIFPTWWASMPAVLKGYLDRVLTNGFAFRYGANGAEGLLKGKRAMVFQTTGTPGDVLKGTGLTTAMITALDTGTLAFCGMEVVSHDFFFAVPYVSDSERAEMLGRVRETVNRVCRTVVGV